MSLVSTSLASTCAAPYSGIFTAQSKSSIYSEVFGDNCESAQTEFSPSTSDAQTVSGILNTGPLQFDECQIPEAVRNALSSGRCIIDERQKKEVTPAEATETLQAALDSHEGSTVEGSWITADQFEIRWGRIIEGMSYVCTLLTVLGPPLLYVADKVLDGVDAIVHRAEDFGIRAGGALARALN